jgi:c-di-GMP-binding flagellar brake protein YcgR
MASAQMGPRLGSATPMRKIVERRSARRYELSLTLAIFPFTGRIIPQEQADLPRGTTRDISTGGIYFTTKEALTPGSELAFALILPAELTHGRDVFVCAKGKVVRTEKKKEHGIEHTGVGAIIEGYEIVKDDPLYREFFGAETGSVWPPSPSI